MGLSHSPSIVTDGLVLCLDAANRRSYPGSGTSWLDLSGNGNNATTSNSPTFSENNGGYFDYDGTDDYIIADNSQMSFTNAVMALEAWVNLDSLSNAGILSKEDYALNQREWILCLRNNVISFYLNQTLNNSGLGWTWVEASSTSTLTWYHVIGTSNGSGVGKLYINGELEDTNNSFTSSSQNGTAPIKIGCETNNGSNFNPLDGRISLVRIYNKYLSADEVRRNYLATKSRFNL